MSSRIGITPNRSVTTDAECQHVLTRGKRKGQKCGKSAYYANGRCHKHNKTAMTKNRRKCKVAYANMKGEERAELLTHARERRDKETPEQRTYQHRKYDAERPRRNNKQ